MKPLSISYLPIRKRYFSGLVLMAAMIITGCHSTRKSQINNKDDYEIRSVVKIKERVKEVNINTGRTDADEFVEFAEKLVGTKYLYGSADPSKGLDCSGFVFYVFGHFQIKVPRTSTDFTNAGKEVKI